MNLLFVVSHPDDESLWAGGLLHGFSRFHGVNLYVICVSGGDLNSPRSKEFKAAITIAGCKYGVVLDRPLRPALSPLPKVADSIKEGLDIIGLKVSDVNILISHPPYGDEHMHPHHIQTSKECYAWCLQNKIPFACFTCLPLPNCSLRSLLQNMNRLGALQLLNMAKCHYSLLNTIIQQFRPKPWLYPILYTQWLVDINIKKQMLECYRSIDLASHREGYAMFTSNVESLLFYDNQGVALIQSLIDRMDVPGCTNLFNENSNFKTRIKIVMKKLLSGAS